MNIFRLAGDMLHLLAMTILLLRILRSRTCSGISEKSQVLYFLTFFTRYIDLFYSFVSIYNSVMKLIYLLISFTTVCLILTRFKSTYNYKKDTFRVWLLPALAMGLALVFNYEYSFTEILWTFSIYLESVAILPQLFMVAKIGKVEKVIVHYLLAMWSYRSFYILNWIYRYQVEGFYDIIAIVAGVVQTILYGKFFYHYSTRESDRFKDQEERCEKAIEAEGNNPDLNQHNQMVLECWPGCMDSWLAPEYESMDSLDKSLNPINVMVMNKEKLLDDKSLQPVKDTKEDLDDESLQVVMEKDEKVMDKDENVSQGIVLHSTKI